jgi:hypothetical protein
MHAKGHIPEAFKRFVESGFFREKNLSLDTPVVIEVRYVPTYVPLRRLLGLLWNCTDQMPSDLVDELGGWLGWEGVGTYAQAAQRLHRELSMCAA